MYITIYGYIHVHNITSSNNVLVILVKIKTTCHCNVKTWTSNSVSSKITEHVKLKGGRKSATPDYSKLLNDTIYVHRILGNIMFNGKLIQASTNFGCFMTLSASPGSSSQIPESFKVRK